MADLIEDLVKRWKTLEYYDIIVELFEPSQFKGVIPFDIRIQGDVATFKVLAESYLEAELKVQEFLIDK